MPNGLNDSSRLALISKTKSIHVDKIREDLKIFRDSRDDFISSAATPHDEQHQFYPQPPYSLGHENSAFSLRNR